MRITLCRTFNEIPYDVLSLEQAKRMHESRKRYEVIFEDERGRTAEVQVCVDVDGGMVINYLDDAKRPVSFHSWIPTTAGHLFWSGFTDVLRSNDPDDGRNLWGKEWNYKEDGRLWTREGDRHKMEIREDYHPVDVSDRYEPHPAFGDFAGLHRLIRHGPPERVPAWDPDFVLVEPEPKPKRPRRGRDGAR